MSTPNHNESYPERLNKFIVGFIRKDFQIQTLLFRLHRNPRRLSKEISLLEDLFSKVRTMVFDYIYEEDFCRYGDSLYYETPTE
jgi:hypothetical protein